MDESVDISGKAQVLALIRFIKDESLGERIILLHRSEEYFNRGRYIQVSRLERIAI